MLDIENRKLVGNLIKKVLMDEICVREAINSFPADTDKDESLQAAYHALIHREADEDLRIKDILYREEQDDYLLSISQTLERGQDLPFNIINAYKEFYKDANTKMPNTFTGKLKSFFKMLNV